MNIVIVGGGFGGVKTALELASSDHQVTLISSSRNFQYYPALYSTATGHSARESWVPLEKIFARFPRVELIYDTITGMNPGAKKIMSEHAEYEYDELVLALGSVTTYFGIEGLDTFSYGIKSEAEIRALQQHIYDDLADGREDEKRYVIIGAGPTGVELAGAMGEYIRLLRQRFAIHKKGVNVTLIEAAPRVLPRSSKRISRLAAKRLKQLGVHIEVGKKVEKQTAKELIVDGRPLSTQTVIWTSGVANAPFYKDNAEFFELDKRGHVIVDDYMKARDHVYVIGDNAATPYAGLAQTALHDAQYVARRLMGSKKVYRAVQPPSVIPIGDGWAVFEWKRLAFGGVVASWLRNAADLIGYRDVLPIGWAIDTWRAGKKRQLHVPDTLQ